MKRRLLLSSLISATALSFLPSPAHATGLPKLNVYRSPGCGCCESWVAHMREAGFDVSVIDDPDYNGRLPQALSQMASCHVAVADGFAFVGHIPSRDVLRFLGAPPVGAVGLAVPGMPEGSPGMGVPGSGHYDVFLLSADAEPTVFGRY
ncbi:MAG: DUF411 domain-containing protein [Rhizobiales bacterium]|nr:DUF411 domain-containing protein [Hyphomicrobiales bacterium]